MSNSTILLSALSNASAFSAASISALSNASTFSNTSGSALSNASTFSNASVSGPINTSAFSNALSYLQTASSDLSITVGETASAGIMLAPIIGPLLYVTVLMVAVAWTRYF